MALRRAKSVEPEVKTRQKQTAPEPAKRTRRASEEKTPVKQPRAKRVADEPATPARRTRKEKPEAPEPVKKTRASKSKSEVVEAPTRRSKKADTNPDPSAYAFNPYASFDDTLDAIEKHIGLTDGGMESGERRMSTGLLMNDIILGGGVTAGWYTNFGQEQTCKTTNAVTMLISAINTNVPLVAYWDFEGSATPEYIENIMRNMGVKSDIKSIFGVKDDKTGKWVVPPRVRYRSEAVAEKFFDYVAQIQRKLPDKKKIGDNWYYIYDGKTSEGKINKANATLVGNHYDKEYYRKTGNFRIPAPDGSLQAVILVDSYPAMLPEKQDVDDPGSAMAVQARMFSEQLKRVKGKMRGKRIAVLGINQLRLRPAVMMGNPEYEPCGEALKLFSDVRLKHSARALSAISKVINETVKGEGQIEEESSVTFKHGVDNYRYINVRAHKNKLSRPYMEAWLRLWITDGKGNAQGFDPVFDTYMYLRSTGQLTGRRNKMLLQFKGNEASKYCGWLDFKRLILGDRATMKDIYAAVGMKPVDIRAKCFAQLSSGVGIEMFNQNELSKRGAKAEKVDEVSEGDDDND